MEPAPRDGLLWQLTIARHASDGALLVTPAGRIGHASSSELTAVLVEAVEAGARRVVLDVSGVDYLSSAGLLALEAVATRLHTLGGRLVVCAAGEPVRMALELAGLPDYVCVEPTREAALARVAERAE